MCGFFITNNPQVNMQHEALVEQSLRFRGPDCSSGLIDIDNGWLAYHSRLSIIDLSTGVNQPVVGQSGTLVFNGEILNYVELGLKYFEQQYKSDTALLYDLIAEERLDLNELDGFFAFVFIDAKGNLSHAARDKFGVKPLFYHQENGYWSFSSEPYLLKQLFNCPINTQAEQEYYSVRAPIFSQSYFVGVKQVESGHCLIAGEYFNCLDHIRQSYDKLDLNLVDDALKRGLSTRLVSDAPVGLLLSRGVDSHLLKSLGNFDKLYSIGFSGDEDIEYLKQRGYPNVALVEATPEQYLEDFNHLLKLRGEPMSVPNEVLLYRVSRVAASEGIKVLLSGEGADEFFAGYDRIFKWAAQAEHFDLDKFLELYCYIAPERQSTLYQTFEQLFQALPETTPFETVRWYFIKHHMPVLFRRLDFALMAAGIEGREPIANFHTFTVAMSIDPQDLMGELLGKYPLRHIISCYMGEEFAFETKVGFPVDLTKIFDNPLGLSSYELWFKKNLEVLGS